MMHYLKIKYKSLKQDVASINWKSSWEVEKKYLLQLKEERNHFSDDLEYNSLFQYKAQVYHLNRKKRLLLSLLSTISIFYLFFLCFIERAKQVFTKHSIKGYDKNRIAFFYSEHIFSEKIKENKELCFIATKDLCFGWDELAFVFKAFCKVGFNVNILSPTIFRVAQVAYAKKYYGVSEAWVNMEYSCASGILHAYCKKNNIVLKNFMHGDKVLSLRDSFTSFDYFYCWDESYKEIFITLLTNSQIVVESPFVHIDVNDASVTKKICYFFHGCETVNEIEIIRSNFIALEQQGFTIAVKDHPRNEKRSTYFEYEVVASSKKLKDILLECSCIMSQYSTVLYESFFQSKCNLIIDDVSNKNYLKLKERGWGKLFESNSRVSFMSEILNK